MRPLADHASSLQDESLMISPQKTSVVIVGAGAAGIAAADKLLSAGKQVMVLEASHAPGGRIRALEGFCDVPIELGAEEIHGPENLLHRFAKESDLEILKHETRNDALRVDGQLRWLEPESDSFIRRALEWIPRLQSYHGPTRSVREQLIIERFPRRLWHYLDSRLGVEHGTTIERLSMTGFDGYEPNWELREQNYTVNGRYLDLLKPMLTRVLPHIRFKSAVRRVEWGRAPAVFLENGERFPADTVILTTSLVVLQRGLVEFSPALPERTKQVFARLSMDGGMKVILRFRERFWPENLYFLHTDGFFPQFWSSAKNKSPNPRVLTAFLGGERFEVLRQLGLDPVEYATKELDELFGNQAASSRFETAHVEDWSMEPWIGGLYSYTGMRELPGDRACLQDILGGNLAFAGEATDDQGCHGTVHGAIKSGWRAAQSLLDDSNAGRNLEGIKA